MNVIIIRLKLYLCALNKKKPMLSSVGNWEEKKRFEMKLSFITQSHAHTHAYSIHCFNAITPSWWMQFIVGTVFVCRNNFLHRSWWYCYWIFFAHSTSPIFVSHFVIFLCFFLLSSEHFMCWTSANGNYIDCNTHFVSNRTNVFAVTIQINRPFQIKSSTKSKSRIILFVIKL